MSHSLAQLFGVGRAPRVPREIREAVGGRRVLAACRDADQGWLIATRHSLHHVADEVRSWSWEQVLRADWDQESECLTVVPVAAFGRPVQPAVLVGLEGAVDALAVIRERVSASVVVQRSVAVSGRRGLMVFARRPPSGGALSWAFELDDGLDPDSPEVVEAMDDALRAAKESIGEQPR